MPLWAKVDVDMPTDSKLYGQPIATRHLWTCLVCLAKKQDDHGSIHDYDCALLAGHFNIPRKAVANGLTHLQAVRMIELDTDGTIRLLNYTKWQGEVTTKELQTMWRERQNKGRSVTRDIATLSRVTTPPCHADVTRLEVEVDQEKANNLVASSPPAPPLPTIAELSDGWPPELLERLRIALISTRASGSMSEGKWRSFLTKALNFSPAIRVQSTTEYLDRAYAADAKDERYLLGIMRGEKARAKRSGATALQLSPTLATETTGRKVL